MARRFAHSIYWPKVSTLYHRWYRQCGNRVITEPMTINKNVSLEASVGTVVIGAP